MKSKYFAFTLLFLFNLCTIAHTEVFRVHKTHVLQMPESGAIECLAGINDAVEIKFAKDTTFLQAIEVEVKIPEVISRYPGSIAYSLYTGITPTPTSTTIDYSGTREMIDILPGRLSMSITVPLVENHTIKQSPYTTIIPDIYTIKDGSLFIRLQMVMKGSPESFDNEMIIVTAKPIYVDKGRLILETTYPVNEMQESIEKPYSIFIDEKPVTLQNEELILETGIHHLAIVSEYYRNETRMFTVEQAQNTLVQIALRDVAPTLQFVVPEQTIIYFNNTQIENKVDPFVIQEGDHTIRFVVNDYEVTKTLQAVKGRSYIMNMSINIDVTENQ